MRIAVVGPISTAGVAPFLQCAPPADFPVGYGGAPFISTQIASLLELGHEVVAITCGGNPAGRNSQPRLLEGKNFEFWCCPARQHSIRPQHGRVGRVVDFFRYERRHLDAVIRGADPDVVHAHWAYEFAMAAMDSGRPYVVSAHDDHREVLRQYVNAYRFGRYLMARRVLGRAKVLTAVSEDLRRRLEPAAKSSVRVVPNPLAQSFIDAGQALPPKQLSNKPIVISVVNGWGRLKNMQSALRAFSRIHKAMADASYHLYGADYQEGGPAHAWAIKHRVATGVHFHGPIAHRDLIQALEQADLMIHPSRSESCPMGIAEALAMGVPVVGGALSGGVPWMVGNAGALVDINDSSEIAAAALEMLSDPAMYMNCSEAAKQRVRAFSPGIVINAYLETYEAAKQLLTRES